MREPSDIFTVTRLNSNGKKVIQQQGLPTIELHQPELFSAPVSMSPSNSCRSVITFDLSVSTSSWLLDRTDPCRPSLDAIRLAASRALAGDIVVFVLPERRKEAHIGGFGDDMCCFQAELGRGISRIVTQLTGQVSYHSKLFNDNPSRQIHGFRSAAALVLPAHYDLGLYDTVEGAVYAPAHISQIAWGWRGAERPKFISHFFDVARYCQEKGIGSPDGGTLRRVEPAIFSLAPREPIQSDSDFITTLEIPERSITVFTNRGLAHGALYPEFEQQRRLNKRLVAINPLDPADQTLMAPIDVLLF